MSKETTYNSGADMWREYMATYDEAEARGICTKYLDMQLSNKDPEELQFCRELYAAMQESVTTRTSIKPSLLDDLTDKKNLVRAAPKKPNENKTERDSNSHL